MQQQSPNADEVTTKRRIWPYSLAVMIAAIPALGYLFAYSYQAGYAHAFGIPTELIRLGSLDIAKVWLPVVGLIVITLGTGGMLVLFLPLDTLRRAEGMVATLLGAGMVTAFLVAISAGWKIWLPFVLIVAAILWIPPLLARRGRKPRKREGRRRPVVLDYVWPWIVAVVVVVAFAMWSGLMGWQYAKERTNFLVLVGEPPLAVLQIYDDVFVTAPYIPASEGRAGQITGTFALYTVDTLPPRPMQYLTIGPMRGSPP